MYYKYGLHRKCLCYHNSRVHFPEEVDIFNKISKPHIFLNINSASPSILIFACIFPAVVQWSYILQEPFNSAGSTATLHKLWEMIIEKERHINLPWLEHSVMMTNSSSWDKQPELINKTCIQLSLRLWW